MQNAHTLGPAYKEFGSNEHPAIMNTFLCIKITDSNVKKFGYSEHPLTTSSFSCIFLLEPSVHVCSEFGKFRCSSVNLSC